jgi:hypothetical protein
MWPIPGDVANSEVAGLGLSAVAAHGALRLGRMAPGGQCCGLRQREQSPHGTRSDASGAALIRAVLMTRHGERCHTRPEGAR